MLNLACRLGSDNQLDTLGGLDLSTRAGTYKTCGHEEMLI